MTGHRHKQILATVNRLSGDGQYINGKIEVEVDYRLKYLIETLNNIEGVTTFESCQGKKGRAPASIHMVVADGYDILGIAELLFGKIKRVCLCIDIHILWSSSSVFFNCETKEVSYTDENPSLYMTFPPTEISRIRRALLKDGHK